MATGDGAQGNGDRKIPHRGEPSSLAETPIARVGPPKSLLDALDGGTQFTDHTEDAHALALARTTGERFVSEDCKALLRGLGLLPCSEGGVA